MSAIFLQPKVDISHNRMAKEKCFSQFKFLAHFLKDEFKPCHIKSGTWT